MTLVQSELQKRYVFPGGVQTEVKRVVVGDPLDNTKTIQIRPNLLGFVIDFLLVGGGGGGGTIYENSACCRPSGGGGGGGEFIECFGQEITGDTFPITIGQGGAGATVALIGACPAYNGGDTCFAGFVAHGGGGGGGVGAGNSRGCDGASGGGGSNRGCGCPNDGCPGGCGLYGGGDGGTYYGNYGGGGGGAGGPGCDGQNCGYGGIGKCSCMSGDCCWYAGGGGTGAIAGSTGGCGGGGTGGVAIKNSGCQTDATYYGGGGGGGSTYGVTTTSSQISGPGKGYQGIVIVRYPTACGYTLYGGNKYCCGDYTIHCFTNDGYLTVEEQIPGIYHNQELGLISMSYNGDGWITIQDKNLGATNVYNYGDTLSGANSGCFYQWGNNYGFPWCGTLETKSPSVNVSGYGPGNYYCCDKFVISSCAWETGCNNNLWGGESCVVSDRRGPAPEGYHIPNHDEIVNLDNMGVCLGAWTLSDGNSMRKYLKMPFAGYRCQCDGNLYSNNDGFYWTATGWCQYDAYYNSVLPAGIGCNGVHAKGMGKSIRAFKDTPVLPLGSGWTILYQ